jgi:hypothetical protein
VRHTWAAWMHGPAFTATEELSLSSPGWRKHCARQLKRKPARVPLSLLCSRLCTPASPVVPALSPRPCSWPVRGSSDQATAVLQPPRGQWWARKLSLGGARREPGSFDHYFLRAQLTLPGGTSQPVFPRTGNDCRSCENVPDLGYAGPTTGGTGSPSCGAATSPCEAHQVACTQGTEIGGGANVLGPPS